MYETNLEKTAENYHNIIHNGWENLYMNMRDELYKRIRLNIKGDCVLELGCGDGEMTQLLAKDFSNLTVVDGSSIMLKECRERLKNFEHIEFIEAYFEDYNTVKKYDGIIMSHVLEHLDEPVKVLKHIKNFLNDKGVLIIAVPNADSLHRQAAVEMGLLASVHTLNEQDLLLGHRRVYNFEMLIKDCQTAGYNIISKGGVMLKPLSNRQIEQQWTMPMINGFMELGDKYPDLAAEIFVVLGSN